MGDSKILIYDGSFNGYLSAIFQAFADKEVIADIQKKGNGQNALFAETETVLTHTEKAKRVWNGIQKKNHVAIKNVYFAFLSGANNIELLLYRYIRRLYAADLSGFTDYVDGVSLKVEQLAKSVSNEKRQLESLISFQLIDNDIHLAAIEPEFDVLPLLSKHFRNNYSDRQWVIYDRKRRYGIRSGSNGMEIIHMVPPQFQNYLGEKKAV